MDLLSRYLPSYPRALVYMLQSTEYRVKPYLAWYWRTKDFRSVAKRRQLDSTKAARLLLAALQVETLILLAISITFIIISLKTGNTLYLMVGGLLFLSYPIVSAHLVVVPLMLGDWLIVKPKQQKLIEQSRIIFANHSATIIAVAGSYGKTSMKELLLTVLSEGKNVAATPANKNVTVSHAIFAASLTGDEEILIIEYGEGKPGDVPLFCEITRPNIGFITGLAPAHLDEYKTLEAAGKDIFALAEYLKHQSIYVNAESETCRSFIKTTHNQYSSLGVSGWAARDIKIDLKGTSFTLSKNAQKLHINTGLLGRHQVGPLSAVAVLALDLGLTKEQIEVGVTKTVSFEHRMQPYPLGGAWVIDDSYNGNIDGVRAGLKLLQELTAKRKIYATPGLVDQGEETEKVHLEMGRLIAEASPDQAVLMQNSVTPFIVKGLKVAGYTGELSIVSDPLDFYNNLDQFVATGDIVMLQNDWTDNYA